MLRDNIVDIELDGDIKVLKGEKVEYRVKVVIIGIGVILRKIGCFGEKEFIGKGVLYCVICDVDFFEDFEVFVVGGGDSVLEEVMYLIKFVRKVIIVYRR